MSRRRLRCPACDKPAVPFDATDDRGRRAVTEGDKDPCPHCGVRLYVHITDDYPGDCRVTVHEGKDPKALVKRWNATHPVGVRVRYWPVRPTSSTLPIETRTRSEAFVASPDHASIFVEGIAGSVNLSTHVDALPDEPKPAPEQPVGINEMLAVYGPKPAPVVAAEGRYAVLTEDSGDAIFQDINDGSDGFPRDAQRSIGSREMALAFVGRWPGTKPVRVLDDGEHEAACEAAVRAERERVCALAATLFDPRVTHERASKMTTENPERLFAFFVRGAAYAGTSQASVEASTAFGWGATPVAEYVLASVAEAETTALRRERDALRAEVEALRSHLGRALRMFKDETSGGDGMREEALRLRLCAGATVTP